MEGIGFVQAGCLQEGYELKCLDGNRETITGIRVEWLEEAITVYNFEVADYHTYYVGDGDVLVHNKCANPSGSDGNQKPKGWRVGDPIDNLTRTGAEPSWNTVRSRYWKNEAYFNPGDYSESNLKLMQKGKAPRHNIYDVPMELHHINGRNIDNPHNVDNLLKVWPWEHAEIDQYRHYTGPQP